MSRWFLADPAPPDPGAYLVCVPHAGGAASTFHPWRALLPPGVALLAVQRPGRETRFDEPAVADLAVLADGLAAAVAEVAGPAPVVLLGHSVGGLLAYEAARRLAPAHLVVAGCRPPHRGGYRLTHLPDGALLDELERLGGLPGVVRGHPELVAMFVDALRADLVAAEGYRQTHARNGMGTLSCAISAFGGQDDALVPPIWLSEWASYTTKRAEVQAFPGGHFFLRSAQEDVLRGITKVLDPVLRSRAREKEAGDDR